MEKDIKKELEDSLRPFQEQYIRKTINNIVNSHPITREKTFTVIVSGLVITRPIKKTETEKARLKELKKSIENPVFTKRAKMSII